MKKATHHFIRFLNILFAATLLITGNALAYDSNNTSNTDIATNNQAFIADILSPFTSAIQADAKEEAAIQAAAQEQDEETVDETEPATETATSPVVTKPSYTPTYGSSVSYSSSKKASDALKANSICRGTYRITFYAPCVACCGKSDGITATGIHAKEGRTIAVNRSKIKLGSKVFIEGLGDFIAEDTGVTGYTIDVFVNSYAKAYQLGVRYCTVYQLNS